MKKKIDICMKDIKSIYLICYPLMEIFVMLYESDQPKVLLIQVKFGQKV